MIQIEIDTKNFRRAVRENDLKMQPEYRRALLRAVVVFSTWAARYTPPNQFNLKKKRAAEKSVTGEYWLVTARARRKRGGGGGVAAKYFAGNEIEPALYKRRFLYVPSLLQSTDNGSFRTWIREAHKRGVKYLVLFDKDQVSEWREFRTWSAAKENIRIKRRGLAKAGWGMNLGSLGQRVPKNIENLVKASPTLASERRKNSFIETFNDEVFKVQIFNMGWEGQPDADFKAMIERGAEKKAMKKLDTEIQKIKKKRVKL